MSAMSMRAQLVHLIILPTISTIQCRFSHDGYAAHRQERRQFGGDAVAVIAAAEGECAAGDARFVATRPAICHLITIWILHRHSTEMDLRKSILKPFKKLKNRFAESIRKRKQGSRSDSNREGRETDVEESEADQSSHLHSETEDVAKSGPSREENVVEGENVAQVNRPTSTPSILHSDSRKLERM